MIDANTLTDPASLAAIAVALALGGILKGATGAGLPIIAIPVISAIFDVRFAVAMMVVPNLITNLWQIRRYRAHVLEPGFARNLAIAGAIGAALGTVLLTHLPGIALQRIMAGIIFLYIALRMLRPDMHLALPFARRLVWFAGIAGGVLQGAAGISAPVGITFLNAMRLHRPVFILTVSCFFAAMCAMQLPLQIAFGVMTPEIALLGLLGLIPMTVSIPLGEWIGRQVSADVFDKIILAFLAVLAVRALVL